LPNIFDDVILSIGDIIIDATTRKVGVLLRREHHVDIVEDDIYFWEVKWTNNGNERINYMNFTHLEEESLKFSILIGTYDWHSINGGGFEL
jgi:hypothetical protein|tara:strand:- start:1336 stop:1608 length:273 start_codon:yes stop_codon:yes gene_type:complete